MSSGNDMKAAEGTYSSFINVVKWSVPVLVLITVVVVLLISGK